MLNKIRIPRVIALNERDFLFLIKTKIFTQTAIIKITKKKIVNSKKYTQELLSKGPDINDNRSDIYNIKRF